MPTDKIPFKISSLIARKLAVEITDDEQAELNRWIEASALNKRIYEITIDPLTKVERDRFVQSIDVQSDWLKVEEKLSAAAPAKQFHVYWYRAAAAVLVLVATLGILYSQWDRPQTPEAFNKEIARITPGKAQATMKLHNGKTILLAEADNQNKSFTEGNGTSLYNANGSVSYLPGQTNVTEIIINELNVPRGGEYKLVLSDGTKVWLNSESQLKFPVQFVSEERVVELTGEAYFEVAHDGQKPFIINTLKDAHIQVYGTSFNINAYSDNQEVAVTLTEGKVSVSKNKNDAVFLSPDQQAVITSAESIMVTHVDAWSFSGWKDGLLIFDNRSMEDIAKLLSRWYNVEFEFENESTKQLRFSADIKRYATFRDVLNIFEKTGRLSFEIHGNTIKVLSRPGV